MQEAMSMDKARFKASPYPLPELAGFLKPFRHHFYRVENHRALERYATALVADIRRKTCFGITKAVAGTSSQALQESLTNTHWDAEEVSQQRVQRLVGLLTVRQMQNILAKGIYSCSHRYP